MNDWIKGGILGSLRKKVTHEIKKHRKTNSALSIDRDHLVVYTLNKFFGERSIIGFIFQYVTLFALLIIVEIGITIVYPSVILPGTDDPHIGPLLKDLTSYFLGAQTVMVGLLFPIAVGLVTLIVQREGASSTIADIQVYYGESLVYGVGASGIALSIVLAIQLAWPAHFMVHLFGFESPGELSKILLTAVHLLWLIINFRALWHFLAISLSFVRPTQRARLRRRFAANVSIPEGLFNRLLQQQYLNAGASVLPGSRGSVWFGGSGRWGDVEIADPKLSGKFLHDVWMKPLGWAAQRWLKKCDEQSSSVHQSRSAPTLVFTAGLGHALPDGGVLCRRENGVPLSNLEKFVIRRCFRFKRTRS